MERYRGIHPNTFGTVSYQSQIGQCNFGNAQACGAICDAVQPQVQMPIQQPIIQECSFAEKELIARQAREAAINDLKTELAIAEYAEGFGAGRGPEDCMRSAEANARRKISAAIQNCNNQSRVFRNCDADDAYEIVKHPRMQEPFAGTGTFERRKNETNKEQCLRNSQAKANENALEACREATGQNCVLGQSLGQPSFKEVEKREYIFGKERTMYVCKAQAQAIAPDSIKFTCAIRYKISVRP